MKRNSKHRSPIFIYLIAVVYAIIGSTLFYVFYLFGVFEYLPDNQTLLKWDSIWYDDLRANGYSFLVGKMCNLAFFPAYPYLWRISGLQAIGISIVNSAVFLLSFTRIVVITKLPLNYCLFLLTIPSFIFFFLPYSESFFLASVTLVLWGYSRSASWAKFVGIFFCSTIRSIAFVFFPAFLVICVVVVIKGKNIKKEVIDTICCLFSSLLGVVLVALLQYYETGKWLYFLNVQAFWGRTWQIPAFPLTTIDPSQMLGIDSIAFTIGLICIFVICNLLTRYFTNRKLFQAQLAAFEEPIILSILILAGTVIVDTCFTSVVDGHSNIWSINRHILCTPFCIMFIVWWWKSDLDKVALIGIFVTVALGFLLTGLYGYPQHMLIFLLFFASLYILKYQARYRLIVALSCLIGLILQLKLYDRFLHHLWVG